MNKYQLRQVPLSIAVGSVLVGGAAQAATITVDSLIDALLGTYASDCTLRAAIAAANTATKVDGCIAGSPDFNTIEFDQSLAASTITLSEGPLSITSSLTIQGPVAEDPGGLTIHGDNSFRILNISGPKFGAISVELSALTVANGQVIYSYSNGAGIYSNNADLDLTDVTIRNNFAYDGGGSGLRFENGVLTMTRGQVHNNLDGYYGGLGGGMFTSNAEVTITDSSFHNNSAKYGGGAMRLVNSQVTLNRVTVDNNRGRSTYYDSSGGGINVSGGSLTLNESIVSGNKVEAPGNGGGIHASGVEVTLNESQIINNSVEYHYGSIQSGGGLSVITGNLTVIGSSISGNSVLGYSTRGGGIRHSNGELEIIGSRISNNSLGNTYFAYGGGLHLSTTSATISYSEISENQVTGYNAGASAIQLGGSAILINSTVSRNQFSADSYSSSDPWAGLIQVDDGGSLEFVHVTVAGNIDTANLAVEAIRWNTTNSNFSIQNSILVGQEAVNLCQQAANTQVNTLVTDASCTGEATEAADINLGPLSPPGDATRVHPLRAGSVAIDAGGDCTTDLDIQFDQLGQPRSDGACDLGAFEFIDQIFSDRFQIVP